MEAEGSNKNREEIIMRKVTVLLTVGVVSLVLASAQASPMAPRTMATAFDELGNVEPIHCTPGKNHHLPTWNYRRDGCKRPSRSKAPAKKAPAAKAPPPKSS